MATTESGVFDKETDRLFRKKLMPLRTPSVESTLHPFPCGADVRVASYYVQRGKRSMLKEDFETGGCDSPAHFARDMGSLWAARGHAELVPLAEAFERIAARLRSLDEAGGEVSDFLYVMY